MKLTLKGFSLIQANSGGFMWFHLLLLNFPLDYAIPNILNVFVIAQAPPFHFPKYYDSSDMHL